MRALDLDDENATAAHRMPRPCALAYEEVRRVAVPAPVLAAVVDVEISLRRVGNSASEIDILDLGRLKVQLAQDLLIELQLRPRVEVVRIVVKAEARWIVYEAARDRQK